MPPLPEAFSSGAALCYCAAKIHPHTAMEIATQLAIFLTNQPGALARVGDALAEAGINILALCTSDTTDHTVLRLVPSEPRKALFLLEERGMLVVETDVLLIEGDNRPGTLARIARRLAKARINIEYLYCSSSPAARKGLLVLRVKNPARAKAALRG